MTLTGLAFTGLSRLELASVTTTVLALAGCGEGGAAMTARAVAASAVGGWSLARRLGRSNVNFSHRDIPCAFRGQPYSRKIAIHPNSSGVILINYPGADGNIDGFNGKYRKLAEHLARTGLAAVIRTNNPTSWSHGRLDDHYEDFVIQGLRDVVRYAKDHAKEIGGRDRFQLWLMGFSAGAGAIAVAAQELGAEKILLMAPARDAGEEAMFRGVGQFMGDLSIVLGDQDPFVPVKFGQQLHSAASLARSRRLQVVPNCDHQFRGTTNGQIMSKAPFWAFGDDPTFPSPEGGLVLY